MSNNRRMNRYSSYTPEFQRRINRRNFNMMDNSAQRNWNSSNFSDINTNGGVNGAVGINSSDPSSIRSSTTNAVDSWRHVNSYARNEYMQNEFMNSHEVNQNYYMQHNVPTMFYDPFADYSETASLDTIPIYTNRTGTIESNNVIVQRRPDNSSIVSETKSDRGINRIDRDGTSYTQPTVTGITNGDIQTITRNVYEENESYSSQQEVSKTSSYLVTTPLQSATASIPVINTRMENLEESFAENTNSSKQNVSNLSNQSTHTNSTESNMPICSVCLEDYQGVLKRGSHFIAVSCGHAFCNICTLGFKDSRKCPKCRSHINKKILRLHF